MRRPAVIILVLPLLLFLSGCDLSKPGEKTVSPTPTKVVGKVAKPQTTPATVPAEYKNGDPDAGMVVFKTGPCAGCHTLKEAGTTGTVGPNLDQAKPSLSLVVDRVVNGKGNMPALKGQLSTKQIADVAAFVVKATGGNPNG